MKILQINTVVGYGSTGRICRDISDVLTTNGHESLIIYGRGEHVEGYNTFKISNPLDNMLHFLRSYIFNQHGLGSIIATHRLIKKVEDFNPDLIHLHNIHGYYVNYQILFSYLAKKNIPIVWLFHDAWTISGGPATFKVNVDNKSIQYQPSAFSKNDYPKSLTSRNFYSNLYKKKETFLAVEDMVIITPSKWLKNIIKKSYLNKFNVFTIYNGVDLSKFYPRITDLRKKYNLENKKVLLAIATKWNDNKGLRTIIKLANVLTYDYKIVMIGVDKKTKVRIPKEIITIEHTNSTDELAEWYSIADIFINPTLFDNFPTVNIEALACGTPVITFDTGGSVEAITPQTGKIVDYNDDDKFIKAVKKWPKKNELILKQCVERSKLFDKSNQFEKYLPIYKMLID